MKNYTLNKTDSELFILNYKVVDDEIVAKLASGQKYRVSNTTENEARLIRLMHGQLKYIDKYIEFQNKRKESGHDCLFGTFILSLIAIEVFNFIIEVGALVLLPIAGLAAIGIFAIYEIIDSEIKIADALKNKLFSENVKDLNKHINSKNVLYKTTNKTKKIVNKIINDHDSLTINNVDKIKYEELKLILENIKKEQYFTCEEPKIIKYK